MTGPVNGAAAHKANVRLSVRNNGPGWVLELQRQRQELVDQLVALNIEIAMAETHTLLEDAAVARDRRRSEESKETQT